MSAGQPTNIYQRLRYQGLTQVMVDLEICDPTTFNEWLQEEKQYLKGLTKELEEETLHVEYYQKLLALWGSKWAYSLPQAQIIHEWWRPSTVNWWNLTRQTSDLSRYLRQSSKLTTGRPMALSVQLLWSSFTCTSISTASTILKASSSHAFLSYQRPTDHKLVSSLVCALIYY